MNDNVTSAYPLLERLLTEKALSLRSLYSNHDAAEIFGDLTIHPQPSLGRVTTGMLIHHYLLREFALRTQRRRSGRRLCHSQNERSSNYSKRIAVAVEQPVRYNSPFAL